MASNKNGLILPFETALKQAQAAGRKKHLLLGNGFSIGAHPLFQYGALYDQAKLKRLPKRITDLFLHYGTVNFEEILRYLDEGAWLAEHYKLVPAGKKSDLRADYALLKTALVESISGVHPARPDEVGDTKLRACRDFISQFDNLFSISYDLLLYWSSLVAGDFPFEDGFGREMGTEDHYCDFLPTGSSAKHMYFLHGALHLYAEKGEVRKKVWRNTGVPLIEQIRKAMDRKSYPLVVSEGKYEDKKTHIEASSYLSYCWRKLENIQGSLFIYGHSLSEQDQHLVDAVVMNTSLEAVYVGIYGLPSSKKNLGIIRKAQGMVKKRAKILASKKTGRRVKKEPLAIHFFKSKTAPIWGDE